MWWAIQSSACAVKCALLLFMSTELLQTGSDSNLGHTWMSPENETRGRGLSFNQKEREWTEEFVCANGSLWLAKLQKSGNSFLSSCVLHSLKAGLFGFKTGFSFTWLNTFAVSVVYVEMKAHLSCNEEFPLGAAQDDTYGALPAELLWSVLDRNHVQQNSHNHVLPQSVLLLQNEVSLWFS